jgi:hypothetical protein
MATPVTLVIGCEQFSRLRHYLKVVFAANCFGLLLTVLPQSTDMSPVAAAAAAACS